MNADGPQGIVESEIDGTQKGHSMVTLLIRRAWQKDALWMANFGGTSIPSEKGVVDPYA